MRVCGRASLRGSSFTIVVTLAVPPPPQQICGDAHIDKRKRRRQVNTALQQQLPCPFDDKQICKDFGFTATPLDVSVMVFKETPNPSWIKKCGGGNCFIIPDGIQMLRKLKLKWPNL